MSENEVMTTYGVEEDEPILPSGWNEGDDFFQSDSWSGDSDSADGHSSDTEQDEDSTEVNADDDDLPTTEEPDTENSQSAGDDQNAAEPDGAAEQQEAAPKTYRLRVNHEDKDVTLSDEEVIARLQKSFAWDAMQEQKTKAKFKEVYQEQIDAGLTPAAARLVAQNECGGKTYEIGEDGQIVEEPPEADKSPNTSASTEESPAGHTRDLAAQIDQVKAIFGDFTEMPEEVANAVAHGADLLTAYSAYRVREGQKAAASLKKENEVLKQNAASAAKAPVRGVTGGGATKQKKESDFLKGFNSDEW